jgi:U3 small nucleolar RNA-associated protein 5
MATAASSKKHKVKPPKRRPVSNTSLSHPPSRDSSFFATLSAFSPSADLFAIVSLPVGKHRLRVHDTNTGRSISEHIPDSARITALSWATFPTHKPLSEEGQESEYSAPRKKRKKHDSRAPLPASGPDAIPVVALGLSTGYITIFSPSHARVIRTLTHPSSTSSILAFDVCTNVPGIALIFVTSCADSFIRTWNAQTGELLSSSKNDDGLPGTSLSLRPGVESDHPSFLLAHHSIRLLSTSSLLTSEQKPTEEARFVGHASNVTMLRWQPFDSQPRIFASIAESDRHVHIWEVPHGLGGEGKLLASAPLDSDARHISFSRSPNHPSLLVLSASGRISIFTSTNVTPQKTKEKVTILSPMSSATVFLRRSTTAVQVINAAFDQDGQIRVVWLAGGVRPVFNVIVSLSSLRLPTRRDHAHPAISRQFRKFHPRCQYCTR